MPETTNPGDSRLEKGSKAFRQQNLVRNEYNDTNAYGAGHPDALSDGDEMGRGEFNGQIGTRTDILARAANLVRNAYNPNRVYNAFD